MAVAAPPAEWKIRLSLLVMVLYFGSSFTAYEAAAEHLGFVAINVGRFAIATAILLVLARGRLGTLAGNGRALAFAGAYGIGLMAVLMAFGVDRAGPTLTALVMALESPGIALAAAFVARDRPTRAALVSLAIGFTGSVVASGALTQPLDEVPVLAVAAMLGSVAVFSVYVANVRKVAPGADSLAVAAVAQAGALAVCVPLIGLDLLDEGIIRGTPEPSTWLAVGIVGTGSALGYWLISSVLGKAPASRFAVAMYGLPIVGVATAWIVLGDAPYARHLAGGALIIAAVVISERAATRA